MKNKKELFLSDRLYTDENMCPIPYYEICSVGDSTWVAHVASGSLKTNGEGKANAKRIVKSWNEYDKLKEDNTLLIESLEKCIVQFEGIAGYGNMEDNAAIQKAKELLNNIKNDKHENKDKTIG